MTKILLVAALMTSASVAMASKARQQDLQGSLTSATDFQDTLSEPARMFEVSDAFTMEFGGFGTGAEGGLIRTAGDSKWGVYLGKQAPAISSFLTGGGTTVKNLLGTNDLSTQTNVTGVDNPFYVSYAMKGGAMSWGLGLYYANSQEKKLANNLFKKNVMALNASLLGANWGAYLNLGLAGKIEALGADANTADDNTLTMKNNMKIGGRYDMDDMSVAASYTSVGGKKDTAGTDVWELEQTALDLGVESKIKTDNAHFFYGAGLSNTSTKQKVGAGGKVDSMALPLWLGIETEAASWLTLRGAYKQNLSLVDSTKATAGTTDTLETVGAGTGALTFGGTYKFAKTHLDFSATNAGQTGNNGLFSANTLGAQASLTYWF